MESLYLMVGLGNPGAEYARTRHNAGFLVVEELAQRRRAQWSLEKRFNARVAKQNWNGFRSLLVEPQTFMNSSGETVAAILNFYQVPSSHLLVLVDDADLPFGQLRLRPKGSAGGHHGLESIEQHLGSQNYARLKIGIGRTREGQREITNYVLGRFSSEEAKWLPKVLERAANQAECWMTDGTQMAMNRFNGVVSPDEREA